MATKFVLDDHVTVNDTANQPAGMVGRIVGVGSNPTTQTYTVSVDSEGKLLANVAESVMVKQ